jgi:magnesium transporter
MIHAYRWDPDAHASRPLTDDEWAAGAAGLPADAAVWIDLDDPTPDEEAQVLQKFLPVHPLTLGDVTKPRREPELGAHLPKVEEFRDYLFVIVNPLPPVSADAPKIHLGRRTRPQLSGLLTHTVLITHHYAPLPAVTAARGYVGRHQECGRRGPDYLFHLILDEMVDEYAPVVEGIADQLDRIEGRVFNDPSPKLLARLLRLKRQVTFLRKTLVLEREVLARLIRGEFALVDPREIAYYRNVYDHLVRYAELTESGREMVSDLMQTHLAAVSNRLNEVMKVLTMISTVVLPMTLVAGVYGMNFEHMPELKWTWGYPMALGLMLAMAVGAVGYFHWRRWL